MTKRSVNDLQTVDSCGNTQPRVILKRPNNRTPFAQGDTAEITNINQKHLVFIGSYNHLFETSILRLYGRGGGRRSTTTGGPSGDTSQIAGVDGHVHLRARSVEEAEVGAWGSLQSGRSGKFPEKRMLVPPVPSHLISGQISGIHSGEERRGHPGSGVWQQGQLAD